jgi:hypothetical protein
MTPAEKTIDFLGLPEIQKLLSVFKPDNYINNDDVSCYIFVDFRKIANPERT